MIKEQNKLGKLIQKALTDPALKERLKADPKAVLAEAGIEVPERVTVKATASSEIGRSPEAYGLAVRERGGYGQAQFSSNHLEILDEAMSPSVRAEIVAAYREFAKRVNARRNGGLHSEPDASARLFAVARNDFDLAVYSEGGKLRNWRLGTSWDIPFGWTEVIERLEARGRFTREELAGILGDATKADRALEALARFGVIQAVAEDRRAWPKLYRTESGRSAYSVGEAPAISRPSRSGRSCLTSARR